MNVTIILIPKPRKNGGSLSQKSGIAHHEICRLCRISKPTLVVYLKQYQAGGIEQLKSLAIRMSSELDKHGKPLESYFKEHPPRTVAEAQYAIKEQTGIERCPTQIQVFLKRLGMKCRKVGYVPGRAANPDKQAEQETFKTQKLEPRLASRLGNAGFCLWTPHTLCCVYLSTVWCFTVCLLLRLPGGNVSMCWRSGCRDERNLHDYKRNIHQRQSVCLLLTKIAAKYAGEAITIVLDNARYQKCELVFQHAYSRNIELLFLPSYSPHLNLIERLWRFTRKECLYSVLPKV